jgi:NAD(P)-dependent dehydrogenase (short-subunit alcohol dehydrogenase family)
LDPELLNFSTFTKEKVMTLKNQKIVVVGGSSGMGLAAAQALAKTGAAVVIAGRSREKLDAAKDSIYG